MASSPLPAAVHGVGAAKKMIIKRSRKAISLSEIATEPILELTLETKLIDCLKKSNFHDPEQDYAPNQDVKNLITPEAVQKEIENYDLARQLLTANHHKAKYEDIEKEYRDSLAQWIPEYGYRTFATAVVSGFNSLDLIHFIAEYADEQLDDEDLPLTQAEGIVRKCVPEAAKVRNFCSQRWSFLAPIFRIEQFDYNFSNNCIFPFEKDAMRSRTGAFGSVSKVRVHQDHQEHAGMENVSISLACVTTGFELIP